MIDYVSRKHNHLRRLCGTRLKPWVVATVATSARFGASLRETSFRNVFKIWGISNQTAAVVMIEQHWSCGSVAATKQVRKWLCSSLLLGNAHWHIRLHRSASKAQTVKEDHVCASENSKETLHLTSCSETRISLCWLPWSLTMASRISLRRATSVLSSWNHTMHRFTS